LSPIQETTANPVTTITTSAPAKVILFGEHGVNRQQPALATAIDLRLTCRVRTQAEETYLFRAGSYQSRLSRADLLAYKAEIDALRQTQALDEIRLRARDYFAPTRYVLAHVVEQHGGPGLAIEWESTLPSGGGLGSGAAASAALALAAGLAAGVELSPQQVAWLAWQGDIIAHGGVASGLDSGASAVGGLIRYTLAEGPQPLPTQITLPMVVGNTGVRAKTAEVNTGVREWLAAHPERMHLFQEMGWLERQAEAALAAQDLATLGHLMNLNQLLLEKIGVCHPMNERLIAAALRAGALGAKISGSGGGGIIIALTEADQQAAVAAAIEAVGGTSIQTIAGARGICLERVETSD
jgi:mevalonate kinase